MVRLQKMVSLYLLFWFPRFVYKIPEKVFLFHRSKPNLLIKLNSINLSLLLKIPNIFYSSIVVYRIDRVNFKYTTTFILDICLYHLSNIFIHVTFANVTPIFDDMFESRFRFQSVVLIRLKLIVVFNQFAHFAMQIGVRFNPRGQSVQNLNTHGYKTAT